MKKSILTIMLSMLILTCSFGQIQTITASLTPVQATSCVNTNINMQYQISNMSAVTTTLVGCCKIRCNAIVIGTTPSFTLVIPGNTTTTLSPISGLLPTLPDGSYNILVQFYNTCSVQSGGIFPTTPYQIYLLNPPGTPTITASGSTSLCPSGSVQLTASGVGTYSWTGGQTTQTISATAPNTYTVKVTNQCGIGTSNPIVLTQIPMPTISVSGNTVGCGNIALASSASNYTAINWSNGQNGVNATATVTGSYYATAVNSCGSVSSNTLSVTINTIPAVSASTTNTMLCNGQSSTLTAIGANSYTWNAGPISNSYVVTPTVNTTYTVIGESVNGCTNTAMVTQNVTTCTGVENVNSVSLVNKIYPVPANETIYVELSNVNDNSKVNISIYSIDGKQVLSETQELEMNKVVLNVSNLQAGIYVMQIIQNGYKASKNIVIAH